MGEQFGTDFAAAARKSSSSAGNGIADDLKNSIGGAGKDAGNRFMEGLRAGLAGNTPSVDIDTSPIDRKLGEVDARLRGLSGGSAQIDVDIAPALASLVALEAEINRVNGLKINISADSDTAAAMSDLEALDVAAHALDGKNVKINADADIAFALGELGVVDVAAKALDGKDVNIDVNVKAAAAIASLGATTLASGVASAATSSLGFVFSKVGLIIEGVTPLVGAVGGAFAALPAALSVAGAAAGVVMLGMDGIKAAAQSMIPALDTVKASVSATFDKGLTPVFQQVAGILPQLTGGLNGVASSLVGMVSGFANVITSAAGVQQINTILENTQKFFVALTPAVTTFTQNFLSMASVGSGAMVGLADQLSKAATQFKNLLAQSQATGQFQAALTGLNATVGGLLDLFNQLMFGAIALGAALGNQLGSTLSLIGNAITALVPVLAGLGGGFLTVVSAIITALLPAVNTLAPVLGQLASAFGSALGQAIMSLGPVLGQLAGSLATVLQSLIPLLGPLGTLATAIGQTLAQALIGLMPLIQAIVVAVGQALVAALNAIMPMMPMLITAFNSIISAVLPLVPVIMQLVTALISALAPVIPPLVQAIVMLVQALAPVVGVVIQVATALVGALAPILPVVAQLIVSLVSAVTPLIPPLIQLVQAILPPFISILNTLMPIIPALAAAFLQIVQALMPLIPPLLQIVTTLLPPLLSLVGLLAQLFVSIAVPAIQLVATIISALAGVLTTIIQAFADFVSSVVGWVTNLVTNFGSIWNGFWGTIQALWTALWGAVGDYFTSTWASISASASAVWGAITGFFSTVWSGVQAIWSAVWQAVSDFFNTIWGGISAAASTVWGAITSFFSTVWNGITAVWNAVWGAVSDYFTSIWSSISASANAVWSAITGFFSTIWSGIIAIWNGVWQPVSDYFNAVWASISQAANAVWATLTLAFSAIWSAVESVWNTIWQAVSDFFTTIWNAISSTAQAVWSGIQSFFTAEWALLQSAWNTVWTAISDFFTTIWNAISATAQAVWNAISSFFTAAWAALEAAWNTFWTAVSTVFTQIWNAIQATATTIWNAIQAFFTNAWNAFQAAWTALWDAISAFFTTIWNAIQNTAQTIWNAIQSFFTNAWNVFTNAWNTFWNAVSQFFSTIWNAIQTAAQNIWNSIQNFFTSAWNTFSSLWSTFWNSVSTVFSNIWNSMVTAAQTIWNGLVGWFQGVWATFSGLWSGFWGGLVTGFQTVFAGIKGIAQSIWDGVKSIFKDAINLVISVPNWIINKLNDLFGLGIKTIDPFNGFADGGTPAANGTGAIGAATTLGAVALANGGHAGAGPVEGIGGDRADLVPALLSPREHVWSAAEVRGVGGHEGVRRLREMAKVGMLSGLATGGAVEPGKMPDIVPGSFVINPQMAAGHENFLSAFNRGQPEAVQASGGRHANPSFMGRRLASGGWIDQVPRFDAGGALLAAKQVAQSMNGKPYIWGGAGPGGADCSGYQSIITNSLRGNANPYFRVGTTSTWPWSGFTSGFGTYTIGNSKSEGHMAGTLDGVNVESGGAHGNVAYGGPAVGADSSQFNEHGFLPEIGGVFATGGGGGGGAIDPAALFDSLAGGVKTAAEDLARSSLHPPPPWITDLGVNVVDKSWAGIRNTAIKLISAATSAANSVLSALGIGSSSSGDAKTAVQSIFNQRGWGTGAEWSAVDYIVSHESGWNATAQNPSSSASGLFQMIDGTWAAYGHVPPTHMKDAPITDQALAGMNYIAARYGDPIAAQAYWAAHGNYADGGTPADLFGGAKLFDTGGWLRPGTSLIQNNTGHHEAVIANPMRDFRNGFKEVFDWFTPRVEGTLNKCFDRWGRDEDHRWNRIPGFQLGHVDHTPQAPPVIPTVPTPPIVLPPTPVVLPTGDMGAAMQSAFTRLAPELSMALKAGSRDQIQQYGTQLLGNQARLDAIMADMSQQMGQPVSDIRDAIQSMVSSAGPVQTPQALTDLQRQFLTFQQYVSTHGNVASSADGRLDKLGDLNKRFVAAFPDIERALHTSVIDANKVMAARAQDVFAFLQTMSADDASKILTALDGIPATTATAMTAAQQTVAPSTTDNSSSGDVTIHPGAVQVTIAGNADSVTVGQLQQVLTDFQDSLVQQVVASR